MTDVNYVDGDTIVLEATLPDDLSSATSVTLYMSDGTTLDNVISDQASVKDEDNGVVNYEWKSGETDRVGLYYLNWEVEWGDGKIESYPKDGPNSIYFNYTAE